MALLKCNQSWETETLITQRQLGVTSMSLRYYFMSYILHLSKSGRKVNLPERCAEFYPTSLFIPSTLLHIPRRVFAPI